MKKRENSKSEFQNKIEEKIICEIKEILEDDTIVKPDALPLDNAGKTYICPDFYSEEHKIIGEIHAHAGRMKGSQPDKIASDILKMLLFEKVRGEEYSKYIIVCSPEEYKQLTGKSALAEAIRQFNINLMSITLSDEEYNELNDCMKKQNLLEE